LNVFIHSGSSLDEESREGFAALAGRGRATRGRSSSLSSSIMMGAISVAASRETAVDRLTRRGSRAAARRDLSRIFQKELC
jgi:hypothetical protein